MNLNWTIAKIEEITEVNPRLGKAAIPDDLPVSFVPMPAVGAGDGSINVANVRPFAEVKKGFTSFQEGDVLFAKITPCMENGKMAVVPKVQNGYGFGSTEFHVLRPKPGIDARYLYYYVSSSRFRGEAEHQMTGAVGQKRVPTQYLRECTIPLAPSNEQPRIVAEIEKQFSRLNEAVTNLKRVKANLKRYKAAVLKAAVEGRLTEEWRRGTACRAHDVPGDADQGTARRAPTETGAELLQRILAERRNGAGKGKYKEPAAPDTSGLPELPEGWVWAKFDQVSERVTKGSSPNWQGFEYCGEGIPFVRSQNVGWDTTDFSEIAFLPPEFNQVEKKSVLCDGDVLLNIVGASIGRAAIAPKSVEGGNVNQAVAVIRLHANGASNQFVLLYLLSSQAQRRIHSEKVDVARANFSLEDIREMPLPFPPLAEQHQIVAEVERRLSIVAGAETQIDANLRRAVCLRQSILKQAFSGQLVPQDPNDEPASVRLERIRNDVGAIHESPSSVRHKQNRAIHESPLRKPRQRTEPVGAIHELPPHGAPPAASDDFGTLDSIVTAILGHMQPGQEYSRAELADALGLTTSRWNAAIQELKRRGQVRQVGEKRGARYVRV